LKIGNHVPISEHAHSLECEHARINFAHRSEFHNAGNDVEGVQECIEQPLFIAADELSEVLTIAPKLAGLIVDEPKLEPLVVDVVVELPDVGVFEIPFRCLQEELGALHPNPISQLSRCERKTERGRN
jgi:hypothetical protein